MQPETSEVQSFRPLLAQAAARFHSCRAAELEASGRMGDALDAVREAQALEPMVEREAVERRLAADDCNEVGVRDGLASFGMGVRLDGTAGRALEVVGEPWSFDRGDVLLREEAAALVKFVEPWSALESALAEHFTLRKIAPPYRLLCKILHAHDELIAPSHPLMRMGANMEVATPKWPAAFLAFLCQAANRLRDSRPHAYSSIARMFAIIKTRYASGGRWRGGSAYRRRRRRSRHLRRAHVCASA